MKTSENCETHHASTFLSEDSHAKTSVPQTTTQQDWQEQNRGCGESTTDSFATWNRGAFSSRTSAHLLFEDLPPFLETLPMQGSMRNGRLYHAGPLDHTTSASDCLSLPLVPTPMASDGKGGHTPSASRGAMHNLRDWFVMYYGILYPPVVMVEYLMGFPTGWTDLEDSATQ